MRRNFFQHLRAAPRSPLGGVLLLSLGLAGCGAGGATGPNLLLVTLDTTRADHLSCYGYGKPTSPNIDRLAADGMRYENAYAVTSWTLPSHASIFTGKFPSAHGAMYTSTGKINLLQGIDGNPAWEQYRANPLPEDEVTLAKLLREAGYRTGGVIGGPWLKGVFGLGAGFDFWDDGDFKGLNGRTAEDITRSAKAFIDAGGDEPFFLFLNYYDPHSPLQPPPQYFQRFWDGPPPTEGMQMTWELQLALYDAEINYTDFHFGALLDHLKRKGIYDDTWIFLTSDHGELMGEHGLAGHGNSLSEEEIHIPLIVKGAGPDAARGVSSDFVQQVDLMPTILEGLGIPMPANTQGTPLGTGGHAILAEVYPLPMMNANPNLADRLLGDWQVIVDGRYKYVWGSRGKHFLFDLEADPNERNNLLESDPARAASLEAKLKSELSALPAPLEVGETGQLDETTLQELIKTGYVGEEPPTE